MGRRKQQRHQQHSDKKRAVRVTRYDMCMNGKDKGVSLPTILVLGDGDFSFSCALIKHRKCADGLTCTSIDSEDILHDKYPNSAPSNIQQLKSLGATVLHGVDATRPETLLQAMSEHLSSQATLIAESSPTYEICDEICDETCVAREELPEGTVYFF